MTTPSTDREKSHVGPARFIVLKRKSYVKRQQSRDALSWAVGLYTFVKGVAKLIAVHSVFYNIIAALSHLQKVEILLQSILTKSFNLTQELYQTFLRG